MIKKGMVLLVFVFMFTSLASAEIIIHNQPNNIYNMGDSSQIAMTVKSLVSVTEIFDMDLICEGQIANFYKNGVSLNAGEEKRIEASLILTKSLIGEMKGKCVIKGSMGTEFVTTNEFTVSKNINIILDMETSTFTPGTFAIIQGNAVKENGEPANGFINLEISSGNQTGSITKLETVNNGFFSINVSFPEDMKAGKHLLNLNTYEEEFGYGQTNMGFINQNIDISQVPKSLEIILETSEVEPGTNAQLRVILHDQTGENIDSPVEIKVENNKTNLIQEVEQQTNSILDIPILNNEKPLTWSVKAEAYGLETETTFVIMEKKETNISLVNNTVLITNSGNVFYNDSVKIQIGNETIFIDVALKVGESQEYKLSAPDGEYEVIIDGELTQRSFLTGRAISAKEKKTGAGLFFSFAWIFVILILGFVAYTVFKKGHKRTFFARMPKLLKRKKEKVAATNNLKNNSKLTSKNKAELSLSIIGDKQKSTTVCMHIKNLGEIQKTKNNTEETLQKIINFAEKNKALTYENQDNLCFIFTPSRTKTFKNEPMALEIAQFAKKILKEHNKIFKQRIEFGLSINNGIIISKEDKVSTKFTSMGSFITGAKKMSTMAHEEILLSKDVADKLKTKIKASRFEGNEEVYTINEVKQHNEANKKFIENFVKKYEKHSK